MVSIGAGGAKFGRTVEVRPNEFVEYNDEEFILARLPLAKGRQYQQVFWALQRNPVNGAGIRCRKATVTSPQGLSRKIL